MMPLISGPFAVAVRLRAQAIVVDRTVDILAYFVLLHEIAVDLFFISFFYLREIARSEKYLFAVD
jgi:hypothetical protein